ncbi:MAG TPA: nuclear transport factor 2 family protein [Polyangiaceae bacterium]|nr:nuclear transport factor 2 family protein [Polyangiaceae bacterium]
MPLGEAAVRGLLDAWLDAQNRGDFAAYEKLYADRFTGVKRSGERTRTFGRRDWMSDRASMFQRPMRVTTSDVSLSVSPHLARVRFEQTWSSAKYRDTGPKELLVVGGSQSALIAREEMLSSSIDGERPTAPESRLRVVDAGVVILSNAVKPDWSRGTLRTPTQTKPEFAAVLRDADEARLPPALAHWKGRAVRVLDAQGRGCDARISSLAVRGAVVPHFSMSEGSSEGPTLTPAQRNEEFWAMSEQDGRQLVGELEPACEGVFALDASDVVPEMYPAVVADAALKQAAVAAFRALPEYAKIQKRYVEETTATTPWHEDPTRHSLGVWSFTPRVGPRLLVVAADAGQYCGEFGASANAVFALDASGKLTPRGVFEEEPFAPASAFDLDGDGQLEILSGPEGSRRERALLRRSGSKLVRDVLFAVPFLDCPC